MLKADTASSLAPSQGIPLSPLGTGRRALRVWEAHLSLSLADLGALNHTLLGTAVQGPG